jgi:hypothetical protein
MKIVQQKTSRKIYKSGKKSTSKSQKNNIKKYFKNLSFDNESDCSKKILYYHYPQNPNYYGIFPFVTDYYEANNMIFKNLLSENNGLCLEEWFEQSHILSGECSNESSEKTKEGTHKIVHKHHHSHPHKHSHSSHKKSKAKNMKCSHAMHDENDKDHKHEHHKYRHGHHHHHKVDLSDSIKKEINYKLQSSVYELISTKTVINTFNYLFQKFGSGIFVQIKDGKLKSFIPFINTNFVNDWSNLIQLPSRYKDLESYYEDKQHELGGKIKYLKSKDLWNASNCLLQTEKIISINDSHWVELYHMIKMACENHEIDDVEFFMNMKIFPVLKNDFTEPYNYIHGEGEILKNQNYNTYHPILSINTNDNFGDLPYPSAEDWRLITQEYFRNSCENKYIYPTCKNHKKFNLEESNDDSHICENKNLEWEDKENKCYFLGDTSGCGLDTTDNIRLKLVSMGEKYPEHFDVNITKLSKRDRIKIVTKKNEKGDLEDVPTIDFHRPSQMDINIKQVGIQKGNHGRYKYLISVPSYGTDPEFPYYLSLGSLVLKVNTEYSTWYDHLLKPFQHYIPIKNDLSNLVSTIKWANNHQDACQKIAKNGFIAFKKFFNHNTVSEYWNYLLNSIAHRRLDLSSLQRKYQQYESIVKILTPQNILPPDLDKINYKEVKLGVIIPYYKFDKKHKIVLKEIVQTLVEYFRKINKLKFKIIICEQAKDQKKYNKGQLVNIGLLIAKANDCTHVVVNNLNYIITQDMLPYYLAFKDANKGPVHITFNWNSYYAKRVLTGVCLWNLDMLFKIGGYNNQIWGRGCSDKILYHRYMRYLNNHGKTGLLQVPILQNKLEKYDLNEWNQNNDEDYQQLKVLSDWYSYSLKKKDFTILNKYLNEIITTIKRKGTKCHDHSESEHDEHDHSHNDIDIEEKIDDKKEEKILNESGFIKSDEEILLKYKSYLKLLDKHQHQKEVEHYTFKLISHIEKNLIDTHLH